MSDHNQTFMDKPIIGEISYYSENPIEQWPIDTLKPHIQAMLDDPEVVKFGWTQYTPYFNDGDACVFHVHSPWALRKSDNPSDEDEPWEYEIWNYSGNTDNPFSESQIDFAREINSGHYDHALLELFGDPAEITVDSEGFHVDHCDHD